jgi:hypothetical protein
MKDLNGKECGLKGSQEQEANKTESQKMEETLNFFRIAFCVDGEAKLIAPNNKFKIDAIVELNDSKRGKFFIGILEETFK